MAGIDFLAVASFGFLETPAVVPSEPAITFVDNEDGTGGVFTLSGEDAGTTNTLYTTQDGSSWTSQGSTWVSGEMEVALANGLYWAYVASANGELVTNSPVIQVVASDVQEAATDNVRVAVRTMKQDAVYWPIEDNLDGFGKPVYQDPIEILVRWDDVKEEFIDPDDVPQMSKAKLITDRDLEIGGVIMKGELTDIVDHSVPKNNPGAWEIRAVLNTPSFRGTKFLREVYL